LKKLIQTAKKEDAAVKKEALHFNDGLRVMTFNLKVIPVKPSSASKERYFFVLFENVEESRQPKKKRSGKRPGAQAERSMIELREELVSNQEYQRSLIEQYESA